MDVILNERRDWGMLGSEESHITKDIIQLKVEILRSSPAGESLRMTFLGKLNSYKNDYIKRDSGWVAKELKYL